jgi:hypothetical protein
MSAAKHIILICIKNMFVYFLSKGIKTLLWIDKSILFRNVLFSLRAIVICVNNIPFRLQNQHNFKQVSTHYYWLYQSLFSNAKVPTFNLASNFNHLFKFDINDFLVYYYQTCTQTTLQTYICEGCLDNTLKVYLQDRGS